MAQTRRPDDTARSHPSPHWRRALYGAVFSIALTGHAAQSDELTPDQFYEFDAAEARIGQLLFYDKILSGNKNIACATCHHHDLNGTDGLSLGIGEGGVGLGPKRMASEGLDKISSRIPRNAPALWNLGHKEIVNLFHDGRISISDAFASGFDSPAKEKLPTGLSSILAAQALFPMTSHAEMAGDRGENDISRALDHGVDAAWDVIIERVRAIPAYTQMFSAIHDDINDASDVTIVEVANAIAAFIGTEWQSYDSLYDAYINEDKPLHENAERGRALFFGEARCSACHNGPLFSDQQFYAMALPQFGPGRTDKYDPVPRDVGRMFATQNLLDAYKFRTPSLRNVALTGPYGHNGAYSDLRDMIRHMADPVASRALWTPDKATLPNVPWLHQADFAVQSDPFEMQRQSAVVDIAPVALSDQDVADIEAFLICLTGETAQNRPLGRPDSVPSGLPVD